MKAEVTTNSNKTQTTTKELEDGGRNCTNGHEVGQPLTLDLICNVHTNVTRVTEVQTNSVRGNNCEDNLVLKSGVILRRLLAHLRKSLNCNQPLSLISPLATQILRD